MTGEADGMTESIQYKKAAERLRDSVCRWNLEMEFRGIVVPYVLRGVYSDTTQLDVELSTRSQREQQSPIN